MEACSRTSPLGNALTRRERVPTGRDGEGFKALLHKAWRVTGACQEGGRLKSAYPEKKVL